MVKLRSKKISRIPGIISLTLLPFAFYFFTKWKIQESAIWAIPIFWADKAFLNKQSIVFSSLYGHLPPKRNYTEIAFTGNPQDDNTKLAFAQIRIKEILRAGDTLNGLHFVFNDSSNYGTFVEAVDKLRVEGAKTYMPLENNLWFYHFQPDTTVKSLSYSCLLIDDVIHIEPKISWWTKTKQTISNAWLNSWQLIVLYCCFIISVVLLRRKTNGN